MSYEKYTRRDFVRLAGGATALTAGGGLTLLLDACGSPASDTPAKPAEKDVTKLYDAAKKEGVVVWWTAHYEQTAAEKMAAAFKTKYPGIQVDLLRQTAQVINTRLLTDLKNGQNTCDVFCSTDEGHYPPLKKQGALTAFTPPDLDLLPKEYQKLDPDNMYHLGAIGFVLINYRSDKVTNPPRSWKEFAQDSQWRGKLTTGHPGFSGYVGQWATAMLRLNGDQFLKDLKKQEPKVGRSVNDTVTDIVNGERTVGAGPDNFSLAKKAAGQPIDIVFPSEGSVIIPGPVAVMAKSQHPNAAQLFANFMYSKEYSEALLATSNYPLRADVKVPAGLPALDKVKTIRNTVEQLAGINDTIAKWREIIG
ncbi:MAG: extracellular solute-binding protein [Candidatus Dormibacteraceae bacterium]